MTGRRNSLPGEFEVIRRYFGPLAAGFPGALGLSDDAAVFSAGDGRQLVVTTDALVAGVHFLADDSPADIAAKALRVNVSDLAAMGAEPLAYTLALAVTSDIDADWLAAFADSLGADQQEFGISLAGGDTVATPGPLSLTVCAFGTVAEGRALTRAAARPGDDVYVSGTIGDASLGLAVLRGGFSDLTETVRGALVARYRRPQPRCRLGPKLVGTATAAIDVSDGLIADLGHICEASDVSADIDATLVPLSAAAREAVALDAKLVERVLTGGDDYEILFTASADHRTAVVAVSEAAGVPVTRIGAIVESRRAGTGGPVAVVGPGGRPFALSAGGFSHF